MKLSEFKNNTLMLLNELTAASHNATDETWPALRDEVLKRWGMEEMLDHLDLG